MVSSMLTAIVTVVGVATRHAPDRPFPRAAHARPDAADAVTTRPACCWPGRSSAPILTDVAGFGSLWWASVEPVRDFGTMMVIGSLLVLPAICLLVPALAPRVAPRSARAKPGWGEVQLGHWLMHSVDAVRRRPQDRRHRHRPRRPGRRRSAPCGWRSRPTSRATSAAAAGSSQAYEFVETRARRRGRLGRDRFPPRKCSTRTTWPASGELRAAAAGHSTDHAIRRAGEHGRPR